MKALYEKNGRIADVTFNPPEAKNAVAYITDAGRVGEHATPLA